MPKRKRSSRGGQVEEEYEVEKIVDRREDVKTGRVSYQVKWVGWDKPTWEEQGNLDGCDELLAEFEATYRELSESKNLNDPPRSGSPKAEHRHSGSNKSKKTRKSAGGHKSTPKETVIGEDGQDDSSLHVEVDEDNLPVEEEALCVLGATDSPFLAFLISFKGGRQSLVKKEICRNRYSKILCDFLLERIQMTSSGH